MANPVADIQIHASLIDDYLYVQDQPVVPGIGRFVAVQDTAGPAPVTHLFTLDSSGNLLHFRPDTTSHSGWTVDQVPYRSRSGSITALSAVFYKGVLDVLLSFTDRSVQLIRWAGGDSWFYANIDSGLENFLNYNQLGPNRAGLFIDSQGVRYVYAALEFMGKYFPQGVVLGCYDESAALWRYVQGAQAIPDSAGSSYWMEEAEDGGIGLLWCDNSSQVGVWFGWMTDAGGASPSISYITTYYVDFGIGSVSAPQVISLPGQSGANSLLLVDSDGNLLQTNGYSKNFTKLTGGANAPVAAGYVATQLYAAPSAKKTTSSQLAIFLLERGTQRLWICRQNGMQGPGVPAFGPWVPLGNQLEAITCATYVAGNPEVFTVDLDMNVYRLAQDATDTIWTTRKIATPTPPQGTPRNIASTMMNIQTVDSAGTPVGDALLTVTVTTPSTLIANQLSYLAEPSAPAVIPLDTTGSAAVYYEATTLAPNRLSFSVVNADGSSAGRWCEGDVVEVKAQETPPPQRTDSVAEKLAGATQDDLQSSGLLDSNYSDPNAAVKSINSLGNWMISQSQQPGSTRPRVEPQAWRLELRAGSGPAFQTLTAEEAEAHFPPGTTRLGGFFGDVWGDIVHAVKHFWDHVTSVVAQVTEDGINFAINLGNEVAHFVVTTARQAAAAAELIFTVIKKAALAVYDAIQAAIAWLKLLFEWQDIIYTHQAFRTCFNQFLTMIIASLSTARDLVNKEFDNYSDQISQALNDFANNPLFGNSFNQYVQSIQSQAPLVAQSGLDGGIYNAPYQQHFTRSQYVYHHAKSHFGSGSGLSLPHLGDISTLTDTIQKNWNADGGFQARAMPAQKKITPQNGISGFFDQVMKDVVQAIRDLVLFLLQGLKEITLVILGLLEDAIQGLQSVLNASRDIPVISYIYKLMTGDDLSILDLLCLIFAVPATILYKVIFGSAPFSSDSVNQLNNLPWPWLTAGARSSGGKSLALRSQALPHPFIETMGVMVGLCNLLGAYITTCCDTLAFSPSPPALAVKFLSWTNLTIAALHHVLGAPWKVFGAGSWSTADKWNVALWVSNMIPFAADTIFIASTGALTQFTKVLGPILSSGCGFATAGLGAATCTKMAMSGGEYKGWAMANSIVPRLARIFKLCILTKDEEEAPVFLVILVGADALFGLGSTATQIGSAVAG